MQRPDFAPAGAGCACGTVRFAVTREPMYVHCCHCSRCQRETGGPFAHHAMVAWCDMQLTQGEPEFVQVPTDSGNTHWVVRCPVCRTALWNEHGSRVDPALPGNSNPLGGRDGHSARTRGPAVGAVTRYVRVGVFDQPARFPPRAHIYLRSKQPWVVTGDAPGFAAYYPADHWPEESRQRWRDAKAALEEVKAATRKVARPKR